MKPCRIHITGASGSGTTTLGRALAQRWGIPHADTDDFYWKPTDPAFVEKRPIAERLDLMHSLFVPRASWVLSGSLVCWGEPLVPFFDVVIFLSLDNDTRLARLRRRETIRCGREALAPGGKRHAAFLGFMDWAAQYDTASFTGRSRAQHEFWLAQLPCPVLRLNSAAPVDRLVAQVMQAEPELEQLQSGFG